MEESKDFKEEKEEPSWFEGPLTEDLQEKLDRIFQGITALRQATLSATVKLIHTGFRSPLERGFERLLIEVAVGILVAAESSFMGAASAEDLMYGSVHAVMTRFRQALRIARAIRDLIQPLE